MLCFSLPSVGFSSPILSHSHSFSLSLSHGWKSTIEGSVAKARQAPLSRRGSLVSLWKKLWLIINISLTYNAQQALEEPAGRRNCHPGVVRDGRPGSGTHWSLIKLFNLFVQLLTHPSQICTQSVLWSCVYLIQTLNLQHLDIFHSSWEQVSSALILALLYSCDHGDLKGSLICRQNAS